MTTVSRNVIANVAGKLWAVVLSLAVVPAYLHILGIEGYGLIGFFLTLTAVFSLLDLGLGTALNRQLALYSAEHGKAQEMRDLLCTLEFFYWLLGAVTGTAVILLAPFLAASWIKAQALPEETVRHAVVLMGIAITCQWPRALYGGGLMGLQRQVGLNAITVATATMQSVGGVITVWYTKDIRALIAWFIVTGLAETVLTGLLLRTALPAASRRARFSPKLLVHVWRFAAGMTGISVLAVILTQLDKIILSKVLTLEAFGYYSLAWRVAGGLQYLTSPITSAFFPRLSQLTGDHQYAEISRLYHRGCQLMSVVVLPIATTIAIFPEEFLFLWTRDADLARSTATLLRLLIAGTALNGLMGLPLALQLAYGSTRVVLVANSAAVVVLGPLIYFASVRYGGVGAAWAWLALNCGYVLLLLRMMHKAILPRELRAWFVTDVGGPLAAALSIAFSFRLLVPAPESYIAMGAHFIVVSSMAALGAAAAAPHIRQLLVSRLRFHPGGA